MDRTHTLTEAQISELNRAMRAAIQAARVAGYAASTYVHDHHTHESILHRRREAAATAAEETQRNMWVLFYDLMSSQESPEEFLDRLDREAGAAGVSGTAVNRVRLVNGEDL